MSSKALDVRRYSHGKQGDDNEARQHCRNSHPCQAVASPARRSPRCRYLHFTVSIGVSNTISYRMVLYRLPHAIGKTLGNSREPRYRNLALRCIRFPQSARRLSFSWPHPAQRSRKNPWARMPHSRNASKSSLINWGAAARSGPCMQLRHTALV